MALNLGSKTTYEHELFKTHKSFRSCVLGSVKVRWIILSAASFEKNKNMYISLPDGYFNFLQTGC